MRLFDAIVDANHRAVAGEKGAGLHPDDFADELPVVALTCVDPRLNPLLPAILGLTEEKFIWLRNAGNIITGTASSTMRSLAMACAVKGGKEIAIIGHTDCRVRQTSVAELTERFRGLGIDRSRLPDNLQEFFGLFASERQNVIRGVEFTRQSPLIGPKFPVHGFLADIQTGKLEWIVNGYQTLSAAVSEITGGIKQAVKGAAMLSELPEFKIGEMKFPEFKIGDTVGAAVSAAGSAFDAAIGTVQTELAAASAAVLRFEKSTLFKIMGNDKKTYGPVSGHELEQWIADGRIDGTTLAQKVGFKDWKPLATFAQAPQPPQPPRIPVAPRPVSPFRVQDGKKPFK